MNIRLRTHHFRLNMQAPQWIIKSYRDKSLGKSFPDTKSICNSSPMRFRNRRGILTVPMSFGQRAWVQASISVHALGCQAMNSGSSSTKAALMSPCNRQRTEKEVRLLGRLLLIDDGNTWESVIISLGGRTRLAGRLAACRWCSSSLSTFIQQFADGLHLRKNETTFGGLYILGITSRTTSPSRTKSPVIVCSPKFSGSFSRIASKIPWMPVPSLALTTTESLSFALFSIRSTTEAVSWRNRLYSVSVSRDFARCQQL